MRCMLGIRALPKALAAEMLVHRIREPRGTPETVQVPTRLITRGSSEIPLSRKD